MKVKLGEKVAIDGIRMTCTNVKKGFGGKWYHFFYFNAGEPKDIDFHEDELDALGAVVLDEDGGGR